MVSHDRPPGHVGYVFRAVRRRVVEPTAPSPHAPTPYALRSAICQGRCSDAGETGSTIRLSSLQFARSQWEYGTTQTFADRQDDNHLGQMLRLRSPSPGRFTDGTPGMHRRLSAVIIFSRSPAAPGAGALTVDRDS